MKSKNAAPMPGSKSSQLWYVNVICFALFTVLALTGLVNWMLPRGRETADGFVMALRHLLRGVHQWTALAFIVLIAIHLLLHWKYIRQHLKKMNIVK